MRSSYWVGGAVALGMALAVGCIPRPKGVETNPAVESQRAPREEFDDKIAKHAEGMLEDGQRVFRYDTFGSERFWGDQLGLHRALLGEKKGGVGSGLTPNQALKLGLKADVARVPKLLVEVMQEGAVSFDNPETSLELLRADAVVGVKGFFDKDEKLLAVGITCALCHSTVDDSFMKGIGRRLDGWPNRDLDVGRIVALAPNLKPFRDLLGVDDAKVKAVLLSWGAGKYDAELNQDGKAFRPDGKSAATVIPAAFNLAGQNLHTYSGWGAVPYWNAYVANTQMNGQGTFVDPRLADHKRFPVAARAGFANKRPDGPDLVTGKLGALHFYQMAIPSPRPPEGSFDEEAARRGEHVFNGKARCASCHVPPLFTEPGWPLHKPEEIGIDDFQARRSPTGMYRTTPLKGLFVRAKGGFYHDGRFSDYAAVVGHYERVLRLDLAPSEKGDLIEYLKSL
jgi:hypothetical protein